jgi:hypothetical protein
MMQKLATLIEERLKERAFCLIFTPDLERCWPSDKMDSAERERQIQAFARAYGWHASVLPIETGVRAIFRLNDLTNRSSKL